MGLLSGVIALLLGVLRWIWVRMVSQQDRHAAQLIEMDRLMAKKGDIEFLAKQIDETKAVIAANEKKTSDFRHDMRGETQHQNMMLYLLAEKSGIKLPPRDL